ncbi:MAG TPA: extracellular solute-binding protein [Firmicutes bacterium]|nr:extracellular solute-binding protein [Bacillota bacterium]
MRKWWVLTVLLLLVSSVQAVTLDMWFTRDNEVGQVIKSMTSELFTPKTGIDVKITVLNYDDLWTKAMLALASGDTPDLASFGSEWPVEFGIRGGLVDLREAFPEEFAEMEKKLYPGQMRSLEFMGTAFGLPVEFGFGLVYYRKDIFQENGWMYPETWDDVKVLLPKMQAKKMNMGCISQYMLPEWQTALNFIWQNGGVYVNDDGISCGLNTKEAKAGFAQMMEYFTVYKLPQEIIPMNAFANGDYPIVVGGNWNYAAIDNGFPNIRGKWDLGLYPGTKKGDGTINHAIYNGPLPYGIFSKSKHQKEAWEFLKWFFSDEIQAEFGRRIMQRMPNAFFFSANMEVAKKIDYFPQEHIKVMYEQSYQSLAPRYGIGSVIGYRFVRDAAMSVLLQGVKPEDALDTAYKQVSLEMKQKVAEYQRFIKTLKK